MIWTASKLWPGVTAFVLAGGPSLRGFDAEILRGRGKVIVINDSWRLCSWFDCLYFTDQSFYQNSLLRDQWDLKRVINFGQLIYKRLIVTGAPGTPFRNHPQVKQLALTGQKGLELDPTGLRHGSNSTYAAMNLLYHFGVSRIILLGMDMQVVNGRSHWHDEPRPDGFDKVLKYTMLPQYDALVEPMRVAGIEVLNATPGSALACWPLVSLTDVLSESAAA